MSRFDLDTLPRTTFKRSMSVLMRARPVLSTMVKPAGRVVVSKDELMQS